MNQAGQAWTSTARHWDATVKIPGANPTTGRHHLEAILAATRTLNTVLRPVATGDQDTLHALIGSRQDLRRTIALAQHLDATLDRLAFTHHRLVDRIADSGQLLGAGAPRAAGHVPVRFGQTTWVPVTSADARVQTLIDSTRTLTHAAQHSTETAGQLRMQAPTQRGRQTITPETLHVTRTGRVGSLAIP